MGCMKNLAICVEAVQEYIDQGLDLATALQTVCDESRTKMPQLLCAGESTQAMFSQEDFCEQKQHIFQRSIL
mgnify:CR=1 FL=1